MFHDRSEILNFYVNEIRKLLLEAFEAITVQAKANQRASSDSEIADLHTEIGYLEDEIKWLEGRK